MIHSSNCNKGYTLIELMVVVVIIFLLLALSLNGLDNLIQSRAFYEGVYYKIEFYATFDCPTLNKYRIYKQTELYEEIRLEGVELFKTNFTDNNVYFYPNGVPGQGGTVTLKNKRGKVLYVIMTPVTARVRISPNPPENW
jgi:prepilin-type N-terminal cleavage/methylation domain-containing protein